MDNVVLSLAVLPQAVNFGNKLGRNIVNFLHESGIADKVGP